MPDGIRGDTNRGSTLISHSKAGNGASRGASISPALSDAHSHVTPWARSQPVTLPLWRVLAGYYFRSSRDSTVLVYYHVPGNVSRRFAVAIQGDFC